MAELESGHEPSGTLVEAWRENGTPVIRLAGDLDLVSERSVLEAVEAALAGEKEHVVFDLSRLVFMDSSGVALLLTIAQQVREVELRSPNTAVRRVLELTGLDETVLTLR